MHLLYQSFMLLSGAPSTKNDVRFGVITKIGRKVILSRKLKSVATSCPIHRRRFYDECSGAKIPKSCGRG